jgi:hypothetical protein
MYSSRFRRSFSLNARRKESGEVEVLPNILHRRFPLRHLPSIQTQATKSVTPGKFNSAKVTKAVGKLMKSFPATSAAAPSAQ